MQKLMNVPAVYRSVQDALAAPLIRDVRAHFHAAHITADTHLHILDVGCGPGHSSSWFSGQYTGVDLSPEYINHAKASFPGKNFIIGDASNFDLTEKNFDVAVSVGLYHHLPDAAVLQSLSTVLRHLKPDGQFHVVDAILPNHFWDNPAGYVLRKLDRGRFVRTPSAYRAMVESSGLTIVNYCEGRGGLLDYVYFVVRQN